MPVLPSSSSSSSPPPSPRSKPSSPPSSPTASSSSSSVVTKTPYPDQFLPIFSAFLSSATERLAKISSRRSAAQTAADQLNQYFGGTETTIAWENLLKIFLEFSSAYQQEEEQLEQRRLREARMKKRSEANQQDREKSGKQHQEDDGEKIRIHVDAMLQRREEIRGEKDKEKGGKAGLAGKAGDIGGGSKQLEKDKLTPVSEDEWNDQSDMPANKKGTVRKSVKIALPNEKKDEVQKEKAEEKPEGKEKEKEKEKQQVRFALRRASESGSSVGEGGGESKGEKSSKEKEKEKQREKERQEKRAQHASMQRDTKDTKDTKDTNAFKRTLVTLRKADKNLILARRQRGEEK